MNNLYRLVYTSVRGAQCDEKEIENIVSACRRNNPGRDITGVLLYSNKRFIQYLEGTDQEVRELYELIKEDPRHSGVMERAFEPIKERMFPAWAMGYKDLDRNELAYKTAISNEDKAVFQAMITGDSNYSDLAIRKLKLFYDMA